MKGRQIVLGRIFGREAAALMLDGQLEDLILDPAGATLHEAKMLRLDCTKARVGLGWVPRLGFDECIGLTADWYGGWAAGRDPATLTLDEIAAYEERTDR